MTIYNKKEELFFLHVLQALAMTKVGVSANVRSFFTTEEARKRYLEVYPPGYFQKKIGLTVSLRVIEKALKILVDRGLLVRELTRFMESPLKVDTAVYSVTPLGTHHLAKNKK